MFRPMLLVVETRNCCVCASASPSVSQTISRFLSEVPCAVQVVHVRAQLQRSDGVSTVAYCLLNAEHGSLHSECFVHAHAAIFPTHEAASVYLLFQVVLSILRWEKKHQNLVELEALSS
ncbi:unnamed protein product [Sphagnum jensenii]|uniref:Uncharacterized protein n=1 Tax=Sphagnum jensenii TaxID=128206 RepID=A0ABP0WKE3_9BRYO